LGGRKGIWPVKTRVVGCWRGCLGRGADLHVAQLMPLPLTVTCFSKIQIGFDGWFPDEHEFASFPQYFCVTLFQKRTSENMASFCLGWMPKQLYKNTVGNSQDSSHPGKITNWFHPYLVQQCLFCSPGNSLVC